MAEITQEEQPVPSGACVSAVPNQQSRQRERVLGLEVLPKTTTEQEFHEHTENRTARGDFSQHMREREKERKR